MHRPRLAALVLAAAGLLVLAGAVVPPGALAARTLRAGMRGADVREVQRLLTAVGHRTAADGAFGRRTARNVRRYERRHRLTIDGRVSHGQVRGLRRRAGRPPGEPQTARTTRAAPATEGRVFPVAGDVRWGDGVGERSGGHDGVDLLADCGLDVRTVDAGEVTDVGTGGAAGRYVVVTRSDGEAWTSMHLDRVAVEEGQDVTAGDVLGTVGDTGNATACHLHLEWWDAPGYLKGSVKDPEELLRELERR